MRSPTQNSLAALRALGYEPWVVEHWDSFARKRRDLWGFVDILALRGDEILAVQTTSASGVSARVKKITASDWLASVRKAGIRVEVHGWRKAPVTRGAKRMVWKQRVVDMS